MMTAAAGTLLNRESAYTTPRADVSALVPREAMRMGDLRLRGGSGESHTAKVDLTLSLGETSKGLLGTTTRSPGVWAKSE